MTNGTREFFGNRLEEALEVIKIGQLIQRELALSALIPPVPLLLAAGERRPEAALGLGLGLDATDHP